LILGCDEAEQEGIRSVWQTGSRGRKRAGIRNNAPSDLLPSARPHLLKFVELLKIAPTARSQAFNT
jgi:hypothetical protein